MIQQVDMVICLTLNAANTCSKNGDQEAKTSKTKLALIQSSVVESKRCLTIHVIVSP